MKKLKNNTYLGIQYFVEFYDCDVEILNNSESIQKIMSEAALKANSTIVQQFFHNFKPYGVSGTIVIAESHLNIHTWPEHGYAAVDLFSCGHEIKGKAAIKYLKKELGSTQKKKKKKYRGQLSKIYKNEG